MSCLNAPNRHGRDRDAAAKPSPNRDGIFRCFSRCADIGDLMRRTRAGMGYCQASLCAVAMISTLGRGVGSCRLIMGNDGRVRNRYCSASSFARKPLRPTC